GARRRRNLLGAIVEVRRSDVAHVADLGHDIEAGRQSIAEVAADDSTRLVAERRSEVELTVHLLSRHRLRPGGAHIGTEDRKETHSCNTSETLHQSSSVDGDGRSDFVLRTGLGTYRTSRRGRDYTISMIFWAGSINATHERTRRNVRSH